MRPASLWLAAVAFAAVLRAVPVRAATLPASAAPGSRSEALEGEDQAVPTAVPTAAADEAGPAPVTRAAQAAPTFALPAFIVTGGGEREDLVGRGDLGAGLDTSGGIRTSPGEKGAGQDQRATEAPRAVPADETFTPTPRYAELTASYGLGNTLNLDGLLAGQKGPFSGWLEGGVHSDDGGPLPGTALSPSQNRSARFEGEGAWRIADDRQLEGGLDAAWRSLRLASLPGGHWLQRQDWGESADYEADSAGGGTQRLSLSAREGNLDVPGFGPAEWAYQEDSGGADYDLERSVAWLLLDAGADLKFLDQRWGASGRSAVQAGVWFEGHVSPWSGARLGLGADLRGVGGGVRAFQAGPRLHFEQGFGPSLGLTADFGTGLSLSDLEASSLPMDGAPTVFRSDPLLPNATLGAQREPVDASVALPWRPMDGLTVEPAVFVRELEDAYLPTEGPLLGLWQQADAGTLLIEGARLRERLSVGPWWESAEAVAQDPRLQGEPGLVPAFVPDVTAKFDLGWRRGIYSARAGVDVTGPRQASLTGGWSVPAQADLGFRAACAISPGLTVFIEGDRLAGPAPVWPLDTDPSPYVGVGAKMKF